TLYVNLFIPSELTWKEKGLKVRQLTKFPEEDSTSVTFTADQPVRRTVRVRYPSWATSGMTLMVNGKPQETAAAKPGQYIDLAREWKTGDSMQVKFPMSLHLESLPDDSHIQALMYGPVVLAGDLGTAGLDTLHRYGPSPPPLGRLTS